MIIRRENLTYYPPVGEDEDIIKVDIDGYYALSTEPLDADDYVLSDTETVSGYDKTIVDVLPSFAGVTTHCYKFSDKTECDSVIGAEPNAELEEEEINE